MAKNWSRKDHFGGRIKTKGWGAAQHKENLEQVVGLMLDNARPAVVIRRGIVAVANFEIHRDTVYGDTEVKVTIRLFDGTGAVVRGPHTHALRPNRLQSIEDFNEYLADQIDTYLKSNEPETPLPLPPPVPESRDSWDIPVKAVVRVFKGDFLNYYGLDRGDPNDSEIERVTQAEAETLAIDLLNRAVEEFVEDSRYMGDQPKTPLLSVEVLEDKAQLTLWGSKGSVEEAA